MCRQLLSEAERDLNLAMDNSDYSTEKEFIQKDIEFLERMKKTSKKPENR